MYFTKTAEKILACARELDQYAAAEGLTWDSILETRKVNEDVIERRAQLLDAVQDLQHQALGSYEALYNLMFTTMDVQSVRALVRFNIPANVPEGGISFQDLAARVNVDEPILTRIVRMAIAQSIFCEPAPGIVDHTKLSRAMMTPDIFDTVCFLSDETQVTATFILDALEKWPGSQEPNHTAFNLSRNTTDVFYSHLEKHPERARRAGGAFRAMNKYTLSGPADFTSSRLWQDLDVPGKLLVDVGGNMGHVSQQIAKVTKNLSFLIEDLPDTCKFGENELPVEFHGRITFKPHDFFQDQPIKGADVYFMRMILHDWPDKYCIRILEKLVPALKDGSKVVCCEVILPATASPTYTDRRLRRMDLTMLAIHNATERTETQWRQLFARVDPRFTLEFESWPHTLHGLVIATWHA